MAEIAQNLWTFFQKGGPLAWPILLCGLVAVWVIVERWLVYRRTFKDGDSWFQEAMSRVEAGEPEAVETILVASNHPGAKALLPVLVKFLRGDEFSRWSLETLAAHHGQMEIKKLERGLSALATIGNVAPLLGLMGTVLGMVEAFMRVQAMQGKVDASILAGGIWEALLTTLYGLSVAIPALIGHSYLLSKVETAAADIQDKAVVFIDGLENLALSRSPANTKREGKGSLAKIAGTKRDAK